MARSRAAEHVLYPVIMAYSTRSRCNWRPRQKSKTAISSPALEKLGLAAPACCVYGEHTMPHATQAAANLCRGRLSGIYGGHVVFDEALPGLHSASLASEVRGLLSGGALKDTMQAHSRGDVITRLSECEASANGLDGIAAAIRLLKGVAHELAAACGEVGILTTAPRAMIACYPGGGARYVRHQDNSLSEGGRSNWRVFTLICYANAEWTPACGGCLRIHDRSQGFFAKAGLPGTYADVEPVLGRVVVFDSLLFHEVLPAWRERFAVTLWAWKEDGDEEKICVS